MLFSEVFDSDCSGGTNAAFQACVCGDLLDSPQTIEIVRGLLRLIADLTAIIENS